MPLKYFNRWIRSVPTPSAISFNILPNYEITTFFSYFRFFRFTASYETQMEHTRAQWGEKCISAPKCEAWCHISHKFHIFTGSLSLFWSRLFLHSLPLFSHLRFTRMYFSFQTNHVGFSGAMKFSRMIKAQIQKEELSTSDVQAGWMKRLVGGGTHRQAMKKLLRRKKGNKNVTKNITGKI